MTTENKNPFEEKAVLALEELTKKKELQSRIVQAEHKNNGEPLTNIQLIAAAHGLPISTAKANNKLFRRNR